MLTRRRFIRSSAALLGAPVFIPSTVLGKDGGVAPSNRIVFATIGWGMQGPSNTNKIMAFDDTQVVAACDVDADHLKQAAEAINKKYKNTDCKTYKDFRELIARKDIDAVIVSIPDHWHALVSIAAADAGKHIWGEKPLAKTFNEQQAIVAAVERNKVIWQTGSWQRSTFNFHDAVELVRNGLIGKIRRVEVGLPGGHNDFAKTKEFDKPADPPAELDYDLWLGPSKQEPYIKARVHKNWRWNYNVGGGQLMDWIGHHCDIAHWGLDMDESGPLEIQAKADFPAPDAMWNTATSFQITCKYPGDVTLVIKDAPDMPKPGEAQKPAPDAKGGKKNKKDAAKPKEVKASDGFFKGTKWIGDDGWVYVNRGKFEASNPEWTKKGFKIPDQKVTIYNSKDHWRNFVDCIKSGQPTITPVQVAHRSATPGHLGHIAAKLGRTIKWDPARQQILGDAEATALLGREYRSPWSIA
jgi:predicted dehydrogenase